MATKPQLRDLRLLDLDDPAAPARSADGFGDLEALATSIRAVGVIEPIIVAKCDGRFRVVAGHRRLLASRMAQLTTVPCVVHESFQSAEEAVMLHENIHREGLNPVDEARFFERLLSRFHGDTDKVAECVRERREYVEARLELLAGDLEVLNALQASAISLGVAKELNAYEHEPTRRAHLQAAIQGGAKTATVKAWREQANTFHRLQLAQGTPAPPAAEPPPAPAPANPFVCFYCGSHEEIHAMRQVYIHGSCVGLLRSALSIRREE